jgi:hypothetical protein
VLVVQKASRTFRRGEDKRVPGQRRGYTITTSSRRCPT